MKVSVSLITYNHEAFITQALEGALMQQTDFAYEIVVGEDGSTDRTREIVLAFQQRHPDKLRLLPSEGNLGMMVNFVRTLQACTGEYVALLEGDDYWTDPEKLQRQADYLDDHPECSTSFHNARIHFEDGSQPPRLYNPPDQQPVSSIEDLWHNNFMATCSVMFRNGLSRRLPEWFEQMRFGDWPLHILHAQQGAVGYLNRVMAVYRIHSGGVFGSMSRIRQLTDIIAFYEEMEGLLGAAYGAPIATAKARHFLLLAYAHLEAGDAVGARRAFQQALRTKPFARGTEGRAWVHLFLQMYLPWAAPLASSAHRQIGALYRKLLAARSSG
jgi:glycosyltransferase involved in cell wall biosynthesis